MRKAVKRVVATAAVGATAVAALRPEGRAAVRRVGARAQREARHLRGVVAGTKYRVLGHHPDPSVPDDVVADRVRSILGPIEKRLDLPRVHVMVDNRIVMLHGEVGSADDARQLEQAALRVPGADSIESHLHVGLSKGTSRPSSGRFETALHPSPALEHLLGAARNAGVSTHDAPRMTRAVLTAFTECIPSDEREHLLTHLPPDARSLAQPARRRGAAARPVRSVAELISMIGAEAGVDERSADALARAVLAQLRALVPEEADDVAAVLPAELKDLWISGTGPRA